MTDRERVKLLEKFAAGTLTERERARLINETLSLESPDVRAFLARMVGYADEWRKPVEWTGESRHTPRKGLWTSHEIGLPTILWIGHPQTTEATIFFETYQWAQIFEGADLTRLRRCPKCNTIYWAFPSHKQGCTPGHANDVAKRKEREKERRAAIERKEGRIK